MINTFEYISGYLKSIFSNDKCNQKNKEKTIIQPEYENLKDDISVCSLTIDLSDEIYTNKNKVIARKVDKTGYINLFSTPIFYFTFNISLIIIEIILLHKRGVSPKNLNYFSLFQGNILIYELFHIVSVILGSLIVMIISNTFKERLLFQKSIKQSSLLDLLIIFGFLMNLFDLAVCFVSIYSNFYSEINENYVYIKCLFIAQITSTLLFNFCIIVLSSSLIIIDLKWLKYKIITIFYTVGITLIYLYCLAVEFKVIPIILIKEDNLKHLLFIIPYFLCIMSNLLILSNYDLFRNSRFFLTSNIHFQ